MPNACAASQDIATNASFVSYITQALSANPIAGAEVDVGSIRDLLEERRRTAGLNAAAIMQVDGRLIASAGENYINEKDPALRAAVAKAIKDVGQVSVILDTDKRVPLLMITPLTHGDDVEGMLITGMRLDDATLQSTAQIAQTDVALLAVTPTGLRLVASTLDVAEAQALSAFVDKDLSQARPETDTDLRIPLGSRTALARLDSVADSRDKVKILSLEPRSQSEALSRALDRPLMFGVAALAALLLAFAAILWWRMLSQLAHLDELCARAARGDHALEFRSRGGGIARRIGDGFNYLQRELDRYRVAPGAPRRRATDPR